MNCRVRTMITVLGCFTSASLTRAQDVEVRSPRIEEYLPGTRVFARMTPRAAPTLFARQGGGSSTTLGRGGLSALGDAEYYSMDPALKAFLQEQHIPVSTEDQAINIFLLVTDIANSTSRISALLQTRPDLRTYDIAKDPFRGDWKYRATRSGRVWAITGGSPAVLRSDTDHTFIKIDDNDMFVDAYQARFRLPSNKTLKETAGKPPAP